MKILIVEDDITSRTYLRILLEKYGICDVVADGIEAFDRFVKAFNENNPFDLICLDIMMPKVDGVKVLKAIRDYEKQKEAVAEKKVKVIMTTALADKEFAAGAIEMGCDAFVPKPIQSDAFIHILKEMGMTE